MLLLSRIIRLWKSLLYNSFTAQIVVKGIYSGFWSFRKKKNCKLKNRFEAAFLESQCAFIGETTEFVDIPIFPHGLHGIHISSGAKIGSNVVIFQNVTIGSNTLANSKRQGAPTIGDNVMIGAGAAIIGNVKIGNNCRIGANCIVTKDMPANTTAVIGDVRFISHSEPLDNAFYYWGQNNE